MPSVPRQAYLVCATPRSGSTLLCRSLSATGVAGRPEEYFERLRHSGLPREPREYFGDLDEPEVVALLPGTRTGDPAAADLERELPRYLEEGTTPNGVFGSKLMWGHFGDLLTRLGPGSLEERLGPLQHVHVTRVDKVAQAVSLWRAVQTRAWSANDHDGAAAAKPVYDRRGIAHLERQLAEQDDAWREWFAERRIDPLVVEYEAFVADQAATVRAVLDFLGIEGGALPAAPPLRRQGDERSERWADRYRAERSVAS